MIRIVASVRKGCSVLVRAEVPARKVAECAAGKRGCLLIYFFAAEETMTESLVARVMGWMARIVPRILGVAAPITVPTW